MIDDQNHLLRPLLAKAFGWINDLRWVAGSLVVLLGVVRPFVESWTGHWAGWIGVGAAILLANAMFRMVHRRIDWKQASTGSVVALGWVELTCDLLVLTCLTFWTGGSHSPLLGLYVLHMIFASLILPHVHAYGVAILAAGLFATGLWWYGQWPAHFEERAFAAGFIGMLPGAVFLSNRLTRCLFQREERRRHQRREAKRMRRRLRSQQRAMMQHEKLVSMGQLTAGVAHEIGNPLASMDALLQVMLRHPERRDDESITALREQVRRIQATVRTLTGLAHPDLGERGSSNLNEVVRSALDTLRYDHRMRRADVQLELAEDLPDAPMVPRAVTQVLLNLVINALDALADRPDARLVVRTWANNGSVFAAIEDNGTGFAKGQAERIFKPFVTTKPVGKGTGLGLPISLALVREHGGDLTAESVEGVRTVFTMRLPGVGV